MIRLSMRGFEMSTMDTHSLRRFIENAVGDELAKMAQDCYYPRISILYKELLHRTNMDEKTLREYSKKKYGKPKWKLLHDPQTTLLILIIQHFLEKRDNVGAMWTFNLFAIRTYGNTMFSFIPQGCNIEYWKVAFEKLSHSHIFRKRETIGNSILYFSKEVFKRYKKDLETDNADMMWRMIYGLKTRIKQSCRSFFNHYYKAKEEKERIRSKPEEEIYGDETLEQKLKGFAITVSKDITIYGKTSDTATKHSQQLTKFNRQLAQKYVEALTKPEYQQLIETILVLMIRPLKKTSDVCSIRFLDYIKKLMAVKTSTKPVYFKKNLIELHDGMIIPSLGLEDWFSKVSVQTRKLSRDFLAYYLAFVIREYLC